MGRGRKARLRLGVTAAAGFLALVGPSGCGADTSPAESVPELAEHLDAVDAAIVEEKWSSAKAALEDLGRAATEAREAGELSDSEAQAILAAADRLESRLPEPQDSEPAAEPTPTPSPDEEATTDSPVPEPEEPQEDPSEDEGEGEDGDDGGGDEGGGDEGGGEKGRGEKGGGDEGGGNGHSSENGPDDGHGN
jgi:hypothetical protein